MRYVNVEPHEQVDLPGGVTLHAQMSGSTALFSASASAPYGLRYESSRSVGSINWLGLPGQIRSFGGHLIERLRAGLEHASGNEARCIKRIIRQERAISVVIARKLVVYRGP